MVSHRYSHRHAKNPFIPHIYPRVSARERRFANKYKTNRCKTCKRVGETVLDHCHATGRFRGWLCNNCNTALGHVYDNINTLKNLTKYLNKPFEASMARVKQQLIEKAKFNGGVIFKMIVKPTQ